MIENYQYSLESKRRTFRVSARQKLEESISKEQLTKLIWKYPINKLAEMFKVYPRIISELADKWRIQRPPSDYWHKKENLGTY